MGATDVCTLLLLLAHPALTGNTWRSQLPSNEKMPSFAPSPTSITALQGETAYLPCEIRNLGDRVVSWMRTSDLHILTWGAATYTSDNRFRVYKRGFDDWTLMVTNIRHRDAGKYECQVNTDPKMSQAVILTIREHPPADAQQDDWASGYTGGSARISGPPEQYVHEGSTVTFTCLAPGPTRIYRTRPVEWTHDNRLVSFQADRGGISVDTERSLVETTSRLTLADVTQADAGVYTCRPPDTRPASVTLVVTQGEHTEAMQHDRPPTSASCSSLNQKNLLTFLLLLLYSWLRPA